MISSMSLQVVVGLTSVSFKQIWVLPGLVVRSAVRCDRVPPLLLYAAFTPTAST